MLFEFDLRRALTPYHHMGTFSGHGVVQPLMPTVCGVADIFSPPLLCRELRFLVEFDVDGHRVIDDGNTGKGDCGLLYAGGTWQIDQIRRRGTYHRLVNDRIVSIEVNSQLVALRDRAGFGLRITVLNRCGRRVPVKVRTVVKSAKPGVVPLANWAFHPPTPQEPLPETALSLHAGAMEATLDHGGSATFSLAMELNPTPTPGGDAERWFNDSIAATQQRVQRCLETFPQLTTDIPGLQAYYERSLVSGLVCLWDRPEFINNPFLAVCGMDGGGICCYPWDTGGYPPQAITLLLGRSLESVVHAMANFGLDKHCLFTPDGTGVGHPYAYNVFSVISLVRATAMQLGPDRALFEFAAALFTELESRLTVRDHLADYGVQNNLLEMRQAGYEHYVASPNAERAWTRRTLADLGDVFGDARCARWRCEADEIIQSIRTRLWDEKAGFFKCVYPDGHEELVLSIQGFDAMRAGACTPEMQKAMLGHLRNGAFLGEYGVSSVSAEDKIHYELNDPDWSGGGAYSGDGPNLAQTLFELGEADLGWDVLRRHFWMGKHLLYYPQEHYCDRPAVAPHKRSNVISGTSAAQAILFGLLGLRPQLDGGLQVQPCWPSHLQGTVELTGLGLRGRRSNLRFVNGRLR